MQLLLFAVFIFVAIEENDAENLQSSREAYNTLILYHFRTYRNSKCFDRIAFKLFLEISLLTQLDIHFTERHVPLLGCIAAGIKFVCGAANALRHTYRFECCTYELFNVVIGLHRRRRRKFVCSYWFWFAFVACSLTEYLITFINFALLLRSLHLPSIVTSRSLKKRLNVLCLKQCWIFSLHFLCFWSDKT